MSAPSRSPDGRVPLAEAALAELGIHGARVSAVGHASDVAAVVVPADRWEEALRRGGEVDVRLRELGFRYAALDLAPDPPADG